MKMKTSASIRVILILVGAFGTVTSAYSQQCPARPVLKIDYHTLDFSENKPVCVRPNGTFTIKLKALGDYPLNYSDVTVKQKRGPTQIKNIDVDSQGVMTVKVGNFTPGTDPQYKIKVAGVGVLDPRVRIISDFHLLNDKYDEIEADLLAMFGLSLSGLREINEHLQDEYQTSIAEILHTIREAEPPSE